MLTLPRVTMLCLAAAGLLALAATSAAGAPTERPAGQGPPATTRIQNLVVIQMENWSFDSLFGAFPGAAGLTPTPGVPTPLPQTDQFGNPLGLIPGPLPRCTVTPSATPTAPPARTATPTPRPPNCFPTAIPATLYNLATYLNPGEVPPPDPIHEFFREQFQINGGRMDQFVIWNPTPCAEFCPGAPMGYWDLNAVPTNVPSIAHYARHYTLLDHYHHAVFGASVPNWIWQICACVLVWPSPPADQQIKVTLTVGPGTPPVLLVGGSSAQFPNAQGTPVWYVVDTAPFPDPATLTPALSRTPLPAGTPSPTLAPPSNSLPLQTLTTIGDRLDAKGVSWAWYWDADGGVEGLPGPFIWFQNYATYTPAYATHVIGGTIPPTDTRTPLPGTPTSTRPALSPTPRPPALSGLDLFLQAAANGTMPQVSFVQPGSSVSLHPGNNLFTAGDV